MNRYKSSTKIKPESSNTIIFQQEFEQPTHDRPVNTNPRYKSIPSKANLIMGVDILQNQDSVAKPNQKPIGQLKMVSNDSSDLIKMNNFLGSKKILERKPQLPVEHQLNPEKRPQRQPVHVQDPNQKLAKLVQKQIEDREKWQKMAEQKQKQMQQNSSLNLNEQSSTNQQSPLIVIQQGQVVKKASNKQKLQAISTQKFSALNLEKNLILQNQGDQKYYETLKQPEKQTQQKKQEDAASPQKKKRTISQLRPLKKKPSTFEVLNQLDMVRKKYPANNDADSMTNSLVKKRIAAKYIQNLEAFNKNEFGKGFYIEGTLERNRSGVCNMFWPQFRIIFDSQNIIYAKKTMKGYDIMLDPQHRDFLETKKLATLHGNFVGSYYNIYEGTEEKQILATIFYDPDSKAVTRQVEVYVKRSDLTYWDLDRDNDTDTAFYSLKSLYLQGDNKCDGKIRKYISKQPYFDEKTKSYKLDFGGKATVLSVKNVILVDAQNPREKAFVFGKCGDNTFNFKAQHPLSPVVIMGYLMSSFNFKFATQ